jgi:glycosyltransferase involved in cell wall biosynthesis
MPSSDTPRSAQTNSSEAPSQDSSPWLSLLIPSYEYAAGVDRILQALASQRPPGVECIIRDDSSSNDVKDMVNAHIQQKDVACLTYVRSPEPKGAVYNWNALMAMARGEYIVLMHHDEAPLGPDFFANLYRELHADSGTDVLVLGCMVGQESSALLRRHMPAAIQSLLVRMLGSGYLLRHNFIGPPSVFVVRRNASLPFDVRLMWLVDVDWMNRCMRPDNMRSKISRCCRVASLQRNAASITSTLGNQVREIEKAELKQICAGQHVGRWATLLQPRTGWHRALASLDLALWVTLKVVVRLLALVGRTRNPFTATGPKS